MALVEVVRDLVSFLVAPGRGFRRRKRRKFRLAQPSLTVLAATA